MIDSVIGSPSLKPFSSMMRFGIITASESPIRLSFVD